MRSRGGTVEGNYCWIFQLTLLLILLSKVSCSGVFELHLAQFTNDLGLNQDGNCCNGIRIHGKCSLTCRTFFRICLKHFQRTISPDAPCTFGEITTALLGNNTFKFPDSFHNPVRFPFEFSWPGTFSLIVEAFHDSTLQGPAPGSPRELIARLATQREAKVTDPWVMDTHTSGTAQLRYSYRVICDHNYYGPSCTELCKPRDDKFGHYTCSTNGTKVCLDGWKGEYCDQATCLPGCHSEHGYCDRPNECTCHLGWEGKFCDRCIPYPGCQHGTCALPWQCNCHEGWGGLFCNQDLNYCTHHTPCKNGATCTNTGEGSYTCDCLSGYTGTNCEIEVDDCQHRPCMNGGSCKDTGTDYRCQCQRGFHGRHCESSAKSCEEQPCQNGGTCSSFQNSYRCACRRGYTGINCEVEVDECSSNPCLNGGRCIDEFNGFRCVCRPGYNGFRCQDNPNDCHINPCLNGGSCVDRVNDFECRCVPGFVGPLCQENVDDCINRPCANGGTCQDLVNDFRCTCAPGFAGKDCRENINECESHPCQNGGTCIDAVDEYVCHCPKGYHGKICQYHISSPMVPPPGPVFTNPQSHYPVGEPGTTTEKNGSSDRRIQTEDNNNTTVITMQQLLLIICLGVGIPIILIIGIIIFLLCNRRRHTEDSVRKENERNEIQNMNNKNKCIDTTIINSIPPSNVCYKITNEEYDSTKSCNITRQLQSEKSTHKTLTKDLNINTNSKDLLCKRNYHKTTKVLDPSMLEAGTSSLDAVRDNSSIPDVHSIVKQPVLSKDNSNAVLFLEKQQQHRHNEAYSEGMLATEV